jgi:hypothetical protein
MEKKSDIADLATKEKSDVLDQAQKIYTPIKAVDHWLPKASGKEIQKLEKVTESGAAYSEGTKREAEAWSAKGNTRADFAVQRNKNGIVVGAGGHLPAEPEDPEDPPAAA